METKIAILRGINVGGKRKILMADLKSMFEDMGFTDVLTYIQSGNVIFKASAPPLELSNSIETSIKERFGFDVPVLIRSSEELKQSIDNNPFYTEKADVNNLHLTFLKDQPLAEYKSQIEYDDYKPAAFRIICHDVFIYCEGKYHQCKLTNNFFEKKLKVGATTRNWKTVLKLMELSQNTSSY